MEDLHLGSVARSADVDGSFPRCSFRSERARGEFSEANIIGQFVVRIRVHFFHARE